MPMRYEILPAGNGQRAGGNRTAPRNRVMDPNLQAFLHRPLQIGDRTIQGRLLLAPMTCLGHVAFRELLAGLGGCGLLFTEMCSARSIPHETHGKSAYFRWRAEELDRLVCQIVGNDPEQMAAAARHIEKIGFFGVDLNFGCSTKALCSRNLGAALLRHPARAAAIVSAVRQAVEIPVFVKYRTGWHDDARSAVELARRFEESGADALTFHPRVAPDRRSRPPRWPYIQQVKSAVGIPVFGNGNVFTIDDCRSMIEMTGCDAVSLGRIGIARPWVFRSWCNGRRMASEDWLVTVLTLESLTRAHFDPARALRRFKRFCRYFCANFRYGHTLYSQIQNETSLPMIRTRMRKFFDTAPEITARPNMNLFH